jgi:ethanolaminephosphotransferase
MTSFEASVTAVILGECSLYATGRHRDLKSLDFSNAWNGMAEHNDVGTAISGFVTNVAGPIWWNWNSITLVRGYKLEGPARSIQLWFSAERFAWQCLFMSFGMLSVMGSCMSMIKDPEFLWSVSAPRLASTLITSVPFHLVIVMGGALVVAFCERLVSFGL